MAHVLLVCGPLNVLGSIGFWSTEKPRFYWFLDIGPELILFQFNHIYVTAIVLLVPEMYG
jgi:hypothetical protein